MASHQRTWFSETKCIKFLRFRNMWMKKILPFTKIDTCTIMPGGIYAFFMLFFLIYKNLNLLNHAWDSHTIGQFWDLAKKFQQFNNTVLHGPVVIKAANKCLTIYSILNNDTIHYIHFYLVGQWKCHVTSTTHSLKMNQIMQFNIYYFTRIHV